MREKINDQTKMREKIDEMNYYIFETKIRIVKRYALDVWERNKDGTVVAQGLREKM